MKKGKIVCSALLIGALALTGTMLAGCGEKDPLGSKNNPYQIGSETALIEALSKDTDEALHIKLTANLTADVKIEEGKEVVIDLNGKTVTGKEDHTIFNEGELTICDSSKDKNGLVDSLIHAKAAIYNEVGGELKIESGSFTRSQENGKNAQSSGGNSFYVLLNHGKTEIKGGKFFNNGAFSSLIENGWYTPSQNTGKTNSVMTISGGSFEGGLNTIKNDDYGVMTISGGKFQNKMPESDVQTPEAIVLNWNDLTISGGEFVANLCKFLIVTGYNGDATYEKATTNITGGTMSGKVTATGIFGFVNGDPKGTVSGEFSGEVLTSQTV